MRCQGMNMEEGNGAAGQMKLGSVFNGITEEYHLSLPVLCLCVGMKAWMKYITKVLETSTPYKKYQGCTDLEVVV